MLTPRKFFFTLLAVLTVVLFAAPMENVDAQRATRGSGSSSKASGSSSRSSGGSSLRSSGSRSSGSTARSSGSSSRSSGSSSRSAGSSRSSSGSSTPTYRGSTRSSSGSSRSSSGTSRSSSTPSRSSSSGSTSRSSSSRSSAPSITRSSGSSSRSSTPAPTRSSYSRSGSSSSGSVPSVARSSYRSTPTRTTASGVPTITRAAPSSSRLAGTSRSAATPTATARTSTPARSTSSLVSKGTTNTRNAARTGSSILPAGPGNTFSERSTLTSFRSPSSSSSFRGNTSRPAEELNGGPRTHSHGTSYYWPSYYGTGYNTHSYGGYNGHYFGWSGSSWYFGISSGHWGYNPYSGSYAAAFLVGTAWHIVPYTNVGWFGYNWGGHCSYWSWNSWRRHRHCHNGFYFTIGRPYWYGYSRWYDYRPHSYSYTSLVYDSLYDEGYDDGYGRGYNRGYENGADDASAYKDNRRRDQIGSKPRPRVPDSSIDRAKTDAAEEYRYEMTRGTDSFTKGDYKTATKAYKEAVILNPESADARYSLAISAFAEGKFAFSAFALRRGVALDPEKGQVDLAGVFEDPVVLKGYIDGLNAELKDNPDDADLLLLSGYVALCTGDASKAAEMLDRAMQASPQDKAAEHLQREAIKALENE